MAAFSIVVDVVDIDVVVVVVVEVVVAGDVASGAAAGTGSGAVIFSASFTFVGGRSREFPSSVPSGTRAY